LKAQGDAHLYKNFFDPKEHTSQAFNKLMTDVRFETLREKFLEGEMPVIEHPSSSTKSVKAANELSAATMLDRIDPRLKRVVFKAGTNSQPAFLVMQRLEEFVVQVFAGVSAEVETFTDLLLEAPIVTKLGDSRYKCRFYFHPDLPSGGFHRLLLHAICQFHGFQVTSKTMDIQIGIETKARTLTVTGRMDANDTFRLVENIADSVGADD
jgi:hypothetical protein